MTPGFPLHFEKMIKVLVFSALALLPLAFAGAPPTYSVTRAKVIKSESVNPYVTTYTAIPEQVAVRAGPSRVQSFATFSPQFQTLPRVAPVQAPVTVPLQVARDEPYDPYPQYNFAYQVHDSISGTNNGHSETRDGDVVRGQYSVLDPDGFLRVVSYTSDPVNGFNAIVDRQPQTLVQRESPVIQSPVYAQAPLPITSASPKLQYSFSYATPAASYGYSF